jgi:methionyl-tRNA formyltransferase
MKIIFMGTPDFAVQALDALVQVGHEIVAVYTQAPKPAGRGYKVHKSQVHTYADEKDLRVETPKSLRNDEAQKVFESFGADLAVVAAYGLILPQAILNIPSKGCINIHGSLLPRWRGAAPIHRALLAGDQETGITTMQMNAGLDTGDMLLKEAIPIEKADTFETLHNKLAALGAKLIVKTLAKLADIQPEVQPEVGVTYADKITPGEARLDWTRPAVDLERQVRAFCPWPGAWTMRDDKRLKVFKAKVVDQSGEPGSLLSENNFTVACGEKALCLLEVQPEGKRPMDASVYLNGRPLQLGEKLN